MPWIQFRLCTPTKEGGLGWAIHLEPTHYQIKRFERGVSNYSVVGRNPNVLGVINPHSLLNVSVWRAVLAKEVRTAGLVGW